MFETWVIETSTWHIFAEMINDRERRVSTKCGQEICYKDTTTLLEGEYPDTKLVCIFCMKG